MANITVLPQGPVNCFFEGIYKQLPEVSQDPQKTTVYSLKGAKVQLTFDAFRSCRVEVGEIEPGLRPVMQCALADLVRNLQAGEDCDSISITIPLPASVPYIGSIVPEAFTIGLPKETDFIYDVQKNQARFWKWLNGKKECTYPPGATHNLGATALLCDTTGKKVLLVENVARPGRWNLPGGNYDRLYDRNLTDTALREAEEETGLKIDRQIIQKARKVGELAFDQNQFAPARNEVWFFDVPGLRKVLLNPPRHEIKQAKWIPYQEIVQAKETLRGLKLGRDIKLSLAAARMGLGAREVIREEKKTFSICA